LNAEPELRVRRLLKGWPEKFPPEILSAMGAYQGNDYVLVGDQLVIVDPTARRVVALVPQIS
jgi:hypothetical protein